MLNKLHLSWRSLIWGVASFVAWWLITTWLSSLLHTSVPVWPHIALRTTTSINFLFSALAIVWTAAIFVFWNHDDTWQVPYEKDACEYAAIFSFFLTGLVGSFYPLIVSFVFYLFFTLFWTVDHDDDPILGFNCGLSYSFCSAIILTLRYGAPAAIIFGITTTLVTLAIFYLHTLVIKYQDDKQMTKRTPSAC